MSRSKSGAPNTARKTRVGRFVGNPRGFGFVVTDGMDDLYISEHQTGGASNGDTVEVETIIRSGRRDEGRVLRIVKSAYHGTDIRELAESIGLPTGFGEKALMQAERVAKPVSDEDCKGRRDLRNVPMVTIDSESAKDLDDAVSLTYDRESRIYHLGVHIADVSHYVRERSALDREALERGTSVYMSDVVIPMLPELLSNGCCSLNAGEDRLAVSCLMDIDERGQVVSHEITESVVRIDERMTYTAVNGILYGDKKLVKRYKKLVPMFETMQDLSAILQQMRRDRGAIDFDFTESAIEIGEDGWPTDIHPAVRGIAEHMIEDFMLAANETVATHFHDIRLPFVYRVHETPDPDRIQELRVFVEGLGVSIPVDDGRSRGVKRKRVGSPDDDITPSQVQNLLRKVQGTPIEEMVHMQALRSLKQARYSTECLGHFGLASPCYCHFTSPIRRYPDLQIHRIIKEVLTGRYTDERREHFAEILDEVALHSSETERKAQDAERDAEKLEKAKFLSKHIGERFEGRISGVTQAGMYVMLESTVEGMIHISKIDRDYYTYEEKSCSLVGERSGRRFTLGDAVKIRVTDVDIPTRAIDFALADTSRS